MTAHRWLGRSLVLLWCVAAAFAAEPSPAKDTPAVVTTAGEGKDPKPPKPPKPEPLRMQPALISVAAKQGGMMSFNDQEPSKLLGGVRLGYEEAFVLCDHVHFWQSKLVGLKRPTLDHALIASGMDAEEPEHVVFDTRASKLPQLAFRGLMHPREVEIIRQPLTAQDQALLEERRLHDKPQPPAPAKGGGEVPVKPPVAGDGKVETAAPEQAVLVRFRVLLHNLGDFSGDLQTTNGWVPHFGWADETEVLVIGDLLPDGIGNPRFAAIDLFGRPTSNGLDKKPARLGRRHVALNNHAAKKELGAEAYDWWAESSRITVEFDDQGRVLRIKTGADYRGEGTPSLETPVQQQEPASRTEPALPAKP
ncbi:MAG TPA: hypothetical protein VHX44_14790 [Planctomycetota bacterium]|nr:hypothetical protein [Planctomycetota bacterium]